MPDNDLEAAAQKPDAQNSAAETELAALNSKDRKIIISVLSALTVIFAICSITFAVLWGVSQNELTKANSKLAAAGAETGDTAGVPELTAQPTDGKNAEALLALARRDASDPRALGAVDAPIVIIEWADFRCPYCAKWALETLPQLQPYIDSGSLRVEFSDLVLFQEESHLAAVATRAAGNQGKYWQMSDAIWKIHDFSGHPEITEEKLIELARNVGVADLEKFKSDLHSDELAKLVDADTAAATGHGFSGTPMFLVNTTPVSGAYPAENFISLIEQYGGTK